MSKCLICKSTDHGKLILVTQRGLNSLREFAKLRNDDAIQSELEESNEIYVHEECRKWYNNRKRLSSENKDATVKRTRTSQISFDWKNSCFFCSKKVDNKTQWHVAQTLTIKQTILNDCEKRISENSDDVWAVEVKGRVCDCADLVAVEARYHRNCRAIFSSGRFLQSPKTPGRPVDSIKKTSFEKACETLEDATEVITISQFADMIKSYSLSSETYTNKHLTNLLKTKYGNHITFTSQGQGKDNIITFTETFKYLIEEKFKAQKDSNLNNEKERMTNIIANMIKAEVREIEKPECYPTAEQLKDIHYLEKWIPETLNALLKIIIPNDTKRVSIAHAIISGCRSTLYTPILFGLGVELDHSSGSKWLNNHLARLGFSITNDEVRRYKQDVIEQDKSVPQITSGSFVQWVADNVDHNVRTIDGKNTFHGMGIVAAVTPSLSGSAEIKRSKVRKDIKSITSNKGLSIHEYLKEAIPPRFVKFKSITKLRAEASLKHDETYRYNLKWVSTWVLKNENSEFCNWSGYMQSIYSCTQPYEKSTVLMLPIIDLQPSDPTCIYSTLKFVEKEAERLGIDVPCITFDQPLWYKATAIIAEKNLNIICRLGGFHLLMSFLGSIGHLMSGSGIEELFEEVYAENVIQHLLSGKAYARALRGHMLAQAALIQLMFEDLLKDDKISKEDIEAISMLNIESESKSFNEVECRIESALSAWKDSFEGYRTAKYWLQYMSYIDIVKKYIKAERTGNWLLHLDCVENMLNLFAASGHIHYTKCGRLYLQQMIDLKTKYPTVHQQFISLGYHSIRRSDRFWAGLWSDLIIEQVMMRLIKSSGGLTRGRGFTESVRCQWVSTAHQAAAIHEGMTELTKKRVASSDQHVELSEARKGRDSEDFEKFLSWLKIHDPFLKNDSRLKSISTQIIVDDERVNCDQAEQVGEAIHDGLDNLVVADAKIKRKQCVTTIHSFVNSVTIEKKAVPISPILLFNRLSALACRNEDIEKYFDYELTAYPTSLFKDKLMRKADKASLRKLLLIKEIIPPVNPLKVIDGCALLHQLHWPKYITYGELLSHFTKSIRSQYGSCIVVFDGYERPSVKDHEHDKRAVKAKSMEVQFTNETSVATKREDFLSNSKNKCLLISKLTEALMNDQQQVLISEADADTDIVKVALKEAEQSIVEVFADDTDIAVLLMHHWKEELFDIIFTSSRSSKSWSIKNCCFEFDSDILEVLPFIHAFSGCDTTSAIYNLGKPSIFKKFKAQKDLITDGKQFADAWIGKDNLEKLGSEIFIKLYGGKDTDSLGSLRHAKYQDMAAKGIIDPSKLPPTKDAALHHCLRVHYQVMVWETLDQFCLDPENWGWKKVNGKFSPVYNNVDCAPNNILKFVRCGCKKGCYSSKCSCRRHGLKCVYACKNCRGDCENKENNIIDELEIAEEDENNIFDILSTI